MPPAAVLQDEQPSNVSPVYLAALPTTPEVLAALQQAHRAKLAIRAKTGTVKQQAVKLPPLIAGHVVGSVRVHALAFDASICLAVGLVNSVSVSEEADGRQYPYAACVVYKATEGYREQASVCGGSGSWDIEICWAPDAPFLTVAHILVENVRISGSAQRFAVVVLDALTGTVVHAFGARTEAAVQQAPKHVQSMSRLELSPSGRMLLVSCCSWHLPPYHAPAEEPMQCQVSLWVLDAWQEKVVVQSDFCITAPGSEVQRLRWAVKLAAWHPSSLGLVFSHFVHLPPRHAKMFTKAGLITANLPESCHLSQHREMGFSLDGQRLAVYVFKKVEPVSVHTAAYGILRCKLDGLSITLKHESQHQHDLSYARQVYKCQWLPCSSRVIFGLNCNQSRVVSLADVGENMPWYYSALNLPVHFSPSRQLMTEVSRGPRILCAENGEELWAPHADKDFDLPHFVCGSIFLPSGCGVIIVEDNALQIIGFA